MSRFYCKSVFTIVLLSFCITAERVVGQQSKITIWPPKEPEFLDEDNDNIRGVGGRDYPIYGFIPKTSFTCNGQLPGFYADEEADCQVFHLCNNNHKISFLCGNGTIFNQKLFTCNWWYNTTCSDSHKFYSMNAELYKVKQKSDESKQMPKIENKIVGSDNNKRVLPQKTIRLPQPLIQNRVPQEVLRQSVDQQVVRKQQMNVDLDDRQQTIHVKHETQSDEIESEDYEQVNEKEHFYHLSE